jgi:hypothetical protein
MSKILWHLSFCVWLISFSIMISTSIHVVINDGVSSFLMTEYYPIMYFIYMYIHTHISIHTHTYMFICHIFFIHPSVDEHLSCFHFLVVVNSATMNMGVQMSLRHTNTFQFLWIYMQEWNC